MLQFVLGRAASGKTTEIYNMIADGGQEDNILLVPEQFSFETERALLNRGCKADVLSFTRLLETVERLYGGVAGDRMNEWDKIIIMSRVLRKLKGSLSVYRKYYSSLEFTAKLISLLDELKISAIDITQLDAAADNIDIAGVKLKIKELVLIFLEYQSIIEREFIDPKDDLYRLYDLVNEHRYFTGKTVYIDAFKDFTGAQYKILECILRDCKKLVVSFTCDFEAGNEENSLFSVIYQNIERLSATAKKYNRKVISPVLLSKSYFENDEMAFMEKNLFEKTYSIYDSDCENIRAFTGNDVYEMLDYVMLNIHKLVREKAYRYRDFVIIARDIKKYEHGILSAAKRYNMPVFMDRRKSLKYSPLCRYVLSSFTAAITLKTEHIFEYIKSGLAVLDDESTAELENYVYMWSIDKNDWLNEWDMNPNGLEGYKNDDERQKAERKLLKLNDIRKKVIEPILSLKNDVGNKPGDNCRAIYNFMVRQNIFQLMKDYTKNAEQCFEYELADFCRQSYDVFMDVLSSMEKCLKNESMPEREFADLLYNAVSTATVGSIPQMLDEISCGSADRIRPARPRVVFLLGMNRDEFPSALPDSGLLLRHDRESLEKQGIELPDNNRKFLLNENFLVYSCACCASEKLFICSYKGIKEDSNQPSVPFLRICDIFDCQARPAEAIERAETPQNTLQVLAENYQNEGSLKQSLIAIYSKMPEYSGIVQTFGQNIELDNVQLSPQTLKKVYSDDSLYISPSQIERFYNCRFSHFCRYTLKLNKLRKADIDVLNRGTIVHYVLENIINSYKKDICNLSKEQIDAEINRLMQRYIEGVSGGEFIKSKRFDFLFSRIEEMTRQVVYHIKEEFLNSEFEPLYCELDIGRDIPSLKVNAEKNVTVGGKIDRTDIYRGEDNYVRVIDYKTGHNSVRLPNILYGLNLQMLIYLYAVIKNSYPADRLKPAGVFYMPAKSGFKNEGESGEPLCMNGVMLDDDDIMNKMEIDRKGRFVPKKAKAGRKDNPEISPSDFDTIFKFLDYKIEQMANTLIKGDCSVTPHATNNADSCKYCDFKAVCRLENLNKIEKVDYKQSNEDTLRLMKELSENGIQTD